MGAECVTEVGDVHDVHLHLQVAELAPALAALALMSHTLNPSWFLEFVVVVATVGRGQAATVQWEMISKIVPLCVLIFTILAATELIGAIKWALYRNHQKVLLLGSCYGCRECVYTYSTLYIHNTYLHTYIHTYTHK